MIVGKRQRFEVLKRDGFRCAYCGASPTNAQLNVDHITPIASGGTGIATNLITACVECNLGKSSVPLDESQLEPTASAEDLAERTERFRAHIAALAKADLGVEPESIGSRLATARRAAGLSQPALASAVGLDPVRGSLVISRYERGATRVPLGVAAELARVLGVPIAWLAEG